MQHHRRSHRNSFTIATLFLTLCPRKRNNNKRMHHHTCSWASWIILISHWDNATIPPPDPQRENTHTDCRQGPKLEGSTKPTSDIAPMRRTCKQNLLSQHYNQTQEWKQALGTMGPAGWWDPRAAPPLSGRRLEGPEHWGLNEPPVPQELHPRRITNKGVDMFKEKSIWSFSDSNFAGLQTSRAFRQWMTAPKCFLSNISRAWRKLLLTLPPATSTQMTPACRRDIPWPQNILFRLSFFHLHRYAASTPEERSWHFASSLWSIRSRQTSVKTKETNTQNSIITYLAHQEQQRKHRCRKEVAWKQLGAFPSQKTLDHHMKGAKLVGGGNAPENTLSRKKCTPPNERLVCSFLGSCTRKTKQRHPREWKKHQTKGGPNPFLEGCPSGVLWSENSLGVRMHFGVEWLHVVYARLSQNGCITTRHRVLLMYPNYHP